MKILFLLTLALPIHVSAASPVEEVTQCLSGKWEGKGHFVDSIGSKAGECDIKVNVSSVGARKVKLEWAYSCPGTLRQSTQVLTLADHFRFDPNDVNYERGNWNYEGFRIIDSIENQTLRLRGTRVDPESDCSRLTMQITRDWEQEFTTVIGLMERR